MKKSIKLNDDKADDLMLSMAIDNFIFSCKVRGLSEDCITNYISACKAFIESVSNKNISKIDGTDINNFILGMREKGNVNNTLRTRIKVLKVFFKFAGINLEFPTISPNQSPKHPYTQDEMRILLAKPKVNSYTQWRNFTIISTLLGTGIRCRTLINIRICDIDFNQNTVYLAETKTSKKYYIPLSSALKTTLKHYLSLYEHDPEDYLFVTTYGEQMSRSTLKQTMRDYNLSRGITKTSLHLARHTFAYNYLRNGGNIVYLQNILGHSKLETTKVYLLINEEDTKINFDDYCVLDKMQRTGIKLKK